MPAVTFKLRWPDGQEGSFYSPSTVIYQHLDAGSRYPIDEFFERAETALLAASERVKQVKGFYCSSAADTLQTLRVQCESFRNYAADARVEVVDMRTDGVA